MMSSPSSKISKRQKPAKGGAPLRFHIVTLFPESIDAYLDSSIIGRARREGKIQIFYYDPKDFVEARDRVDRRPYGGGPGMVLEPAAILRAAKQASKKWGSAKTGVAKLFFSTDGALLTQNMAARLAKKKDILLICGRYEGIDARVQKILRAQKVSVGPYVLTGGEVPALALIDATTRFIPGVLGTHESLEELRTASPEVYTRPEVLVWEKKRYRVPPVLLSGNHAKIDAWKKARKDPSGSK
jgi:tRNA (guanine37-N1)-methyltransferase